jgi:Protein of unknown function (DUF3800)
LDADPPPGVLRWLISCDESGTGGAPYYGFGSVWMPWQRRGDFSALIQRLRDAHSYYDEIKWHKVSDRSIAFYKALAEAFFRENYLTFQCLVVRQADVDRERHDGDFDLARRKHFTMLLTNKIRRCLRAYKNREQTFRIWVDPINSRYAKADEAVEIIANNVLRAVFGKIRTVDSVITRDSKDTASIGLCDVLLGAMMETWQKKAHRNAKHELRHWIAEHLGWEDLAHDTYVGEVKFNIWYFYNPQEKAPRDAKSRLVVLKYLLRGRTSQLAVAPEERRW